MDVKAWHGIHLSHKKNQLNILVIGNYYVNYQNYQNLMPLTSSNTKRTLMHLFLFTNSAQKRTGFNVYAEYTQPQLTFLALVPWTDPSYLPLIPSPPPLIPDYKWLLVVNNLKGYVAQPPYRQDKREIQIKFTL